MLLDYAQNNSVSTYRMLNICTKRIVIIREIIWLSKTYGEYLSRKENTKADTYILQDEDRYYNWAHVKIYPVKNEVRNENIKAEENVNTE